MKPTDNQRMQWILDHVTQLECKEMIGGNFENFIIPATREDIDNEIAKHGSIKVCANCIRWGDNPNRDTCHCQQLGITTHRKWTCPLFIPRPWCASVTQQSLNP